MSKVPAMLGLCVLFLAGCGGSGASEYSTMNAVVAALSDGGVPCIAPEPFGPQAPDLEIVSCHGSEEPSTDLARLSWMFETYFVNLYTSDAAKQSLAEDAAACTEATGDSANVVMGGNWKVMRVGDWLPMAQPQAIVDALGGKIMSCPNES